MAKIKIETLIINNKEVLREKYKNWELTEKEFLEKDKEISEIII